MSKADLVIASAQVGQDLRLVDPGEPFHGLQLDDDRSFDDKVESMRSQGVTTVRHLNGDLTVIVKVLQM